MNLKRASAFLATLSVSLFIGAGVASATNDHNDDAGHKVWVCKYVGTPHVDERLKDGKNPIEVDEHSIKGAAHNPVQVGDTFADAHDHSLVVQIGGSDPGVENCPGYVPPTTTTTVVVTTVPETTIPVTTVPETTISQTTVPETTVPQTTIPETTVPETTVPETTIPVTTVPETTVPETTVPDTTEAPTTTAVVITAPTTVPPVPPTVATDIPPVPASVVTALPKTGGNTGLLLIVAAMLTALGSVMCLVRRKFTT